VEISKKERDKRILKQVNGTEKMYITTFNFPPPSLGFPIGQCFTIHSVQILIAQSRWIYI